MPIHDWTRVPAGTFHFFHQRWIQDIADVLNTGRLPPGYYAMSEVDAKGPIPDVLASKSPDPEDTPAGLSVLDAPPRTRITTRGEDTARYARRADRLSIYLPQGELLGQGSPHAPREEEPHAEREDYPGEFIAVIEIVSPGNKNSSNALKTFVRKAGKLLRRGVHLLIIDLFPPSVRDPLGIHKAIWDQFKEEPFDLPTSKPLTLAAYSAGYEKVAYVENLGVGDALIDMPIFLTPERYVPCPLETTYQTSWSVFPAALKGPLEPKLESKK